VTSKLLTLVDGCEGCHGVHEADRALVERMRAGEQHAFDEFFNASAPRLIAFAARRSALDSASLEDIVQNTLIKAVRNLASYRGEAALFTWLARICYHELADVHRKASRRPAHVSLDETSSPLVAQLLAPEHRAPAAELEASNQRSEVIQVLDSLPERYARVLEAKYGDGLSVDEIARQLGLTVIATQSLLARAREAFRECWQAKSKDHISGAVP
jgi:RNA polymerase sigma-70 factor (ECF subfamily)